MKQEKYARLCVNRQTQHTDGQGCRVKEQKIAAARVSRSMTRHNTCNDTTDEGAQAKLFDIPTTNVPAVDDKPKPLRTDASAQRFFAESWVAANSVVWSWIKAKAKEYAENRRSFSMQQLLSMARFSGEVEYSDQDPDFKVNNTSIPALSRLLDEQCPEVEPFHEKRRSKCDWAFTSEGKQ